MVIWKIIKDNDIKPKTYYLQKMQLLNAREGGTDGNDCSLIFISYWCGYLNFGAWFMKNMSTTWM
jgi:hypothetical protein